jgi:DNA replication initiation complex subunit (GINS family)
MMEDSNKKLDANFFQLVLSLQMAAMQQMGKIASPFSGKVERNLMQAQASIDMLAMLSEKTKNNLTEDEKNLIDRVLYELRMNYVDESKKPDEESKEDNDTAKAEKSASTDSKEQEENEVKNESGEEQKE